MKRRKVRDNRARKVRKKRGMLYEIDTVPIYHRFDKYTQRKTRVGQVYTEKDQGGILQ